ncbi:hypothetical protein TrRE_jg10243 [Triparma retinervis]|uniref:DUF1365 domain-containing protein n=1 Tax=Triparma retinervis TaxID=2557542 RepID=A0A9W7A8V2_9STRA|nr:hypothetical protein TrRE_jg10243 [Triparma retinervis]
MWRWREGEHLRNGEGGEGGLAGRVRRLVRDRTGGKFEANDCKIFLLTNLEYFGYVFNPVSFYYIVDKSRNLKCVVAEVSNTPWLEQHTYVLHPNSSDVSRAKKLASGDGMNYLFLKKFHVSPFHGMDYVYDWDFNAPKERCRVVTRMRGEGGKVEFVANFNLERRRFGALPLVRELVRLPFFCALVQFWIHVEAAKLYLKGATFFPHPTGQETRASRVIAKVMGLLGMG